MFSYSDKYKMYIVENNGIFFGTEIPEKEKYKQVKIISEKYYMNQEMICAIVFDEVKDRFKGVSREGIPFLLGTPLIDLDRQIISYLDHMLDEAHIIEVEFGGFLEKVYQVNVDG